MVRCLKCGGILNHWALDADGDVPVYRCNTVLTSRRIDGSHGPFTECNQYYRKDENVTGRSFAIPGKDRMARCE
jgi:hypothetical protein